jgi:hypothetical protein
MSLLTLHKLIQQEYNHFLASGAVVANTSLSVSKLSLLGLLGCLGYVSVQPKQGFGIGNRNQGLILVSVPIFFFNIFSSFKFFLSLKIKTDLKKQFKSI